MTFTSDTAYSSSAGPFNGGGPPHNIEAEQSVLGAILLSERSLYALIIEEGLQPQDFYRERHSVTYAAMLRLYAANTPIDPLTVAEELRQAGELEAAGGAEAIDELTGSVPLVGNARRYAQIVKENALLRRLLNTTYRIQASVAEHADVPRNLVEQAEKAILEVAHDDRQQDFRSIEAILHDELDKMEKLSREGTSLTGTPSGFKDLDEITGGFQPGNLIILAARPSMERARWSPTSPRTRRSTTARPSRCSAWRCRKPSWPSASWPPRGASSATSCARAGSRATSGRRSSTPPRSSAPRRCTSTTPPTSASSTSAPRPAGCTSRRPTAWG